MIFRNVIYIVLVAALAAPPVLAGEAPVTLGAALTNAKIKNEDFMISKEQLKQTLLVRDKAWASFLPVLKVNGTFTHNDKEVAFSDRTIQQQDVLYGTASATLMIFKGSSIPNLLEAYDLARLGKESTRWALNELAFEVAQAYYAVLAARNLVAAAERSQKTAQEYLAAVKIRIDADDAIAIDETRAQMALVTAQGNMINSNNALDGAMDYLAFLLDVEPPVIVQPPPEPVLPQKTDEELTRLALKRRPDLAAAKYKLKAAKTAVTEAWMDFLPSLGVTATGKANQNTGWSGDPYSWDIVLFMEWDIWDGGMGRATTIEQQSKLTEAKLEQQQIERYVKMEIRQARRDMKDAAASLATAKESLKLARKSRDMVLSRYNAELANSLELTEADDTLRKAEVGVVAQELSYSLGVLQFLRVLGLDPMGREIDNV